MLTQLHIILCTGVAPITQVISMIISYITLALAASRAYFIQRDRFHTDPEPSLHMLGRVFPLMAVSIAFNALVWTFVFGVMKQYAVPFLFMVFLCNYGALKVFNKSRQTFKVVDLIIVQGSNF